jgi:inner membrane protein
LDSITHIAVGACLGEAFMGQRVGKKAMLWGVLAQSLPDFDFLLTPFLEVSEDLLVHRGFSHSILFALIMTPVMALTANRVHQPHDISLRRWFSFFACSIMLHDLLDGFNNYGIGWLEPFLHSRFSFNAIYVVDPFFSVGPGIAALILLISSGHYRSRKYWAFFGIGFIALHLCFSISMKLKIEKEVREQLMSQDIVYNKHLTTPAPFQNLLWFVAAGNDSGFHIGYRSVFDTGKMSFGYFPRRDDLLIPYAGREDLRRLKLFSQGFYTASLHNDTLVFNDLRFGQVIGWASPEERFVFHYYLDYPEENDMVVQRGRFEKLNTISPWDYCSRALGN